MARVLILATLLLGLGGVQALKIKVSSSFLDRQLAVVLSQISKLAISFIPRLLILTMEL